MKRITITILITFLALNSYAQRDRGKRGRGMYSAGISQVDAAQVPEAVRNAFTTQVPDLHWEKLESKGKAGKSHVRYVAVYKEDGIAIRKRFKEDGTPMSSSKYMGAQKLPVAVQTAASAKNPGAKLIGGEELTTKKGQVYYRVRLRNGNSKINSLFDANGSEVTKDKMTEELKDSEGEEGGN